MHASVQKSRVFFFTVVNKMQLFITFRMIKHKCKNKKECSTFLKMERAHVSL